MNALHELRERLADALPGATFDVDAPDDPAHRWFLDVDRGGRFLVVEWRPGRGMGVSLGLDIAFGSGPDIVFPEGDLDAVLEHVVDVLGTTAERARLRGS